MAELTNMEEKLAEVIGLAQAAVDATRQVQKLAKDESADLRASLKQMNAEAAETARRGKELAGSFDGKKSAIDKKARETKQKAAEMMSTYLDEESDALDGFEFLTMAEAGEVGHWGVLQTMARSARATRVVELTKWALPIQQRHFKDVNAASKTLAAQEDPNETS